MVTVSRRHAVADREASTRAREIAPPTDHSGSAVDAVPGLPAVLQNTTGPGAAYPCDRGLAALFEDQVGRTPKAVAIVCKDEEITYAELNARANQIAHRLIALGIQPDDRVALCLPRGLDMLSGILAVLKAGAGYVPLDPAYPHRRLTFMLEDSKPAALLLNKNADMARVWKQAGHGGPLLDLGDDAGEWTTQPRSNPRNRVTGSASGHLAYIIYTSGSSGEPKGVMVTQGNVARLFTATREHFRFDGSDVWTLFHSYAFDFSVWEIWGALLHGGKLVVVPQEVTRAPGEFYALLCQAGVTVLNQTPSAFRQLVAAQAESRQEHRLRWIIFGGEALALATLAPWFGQNAEAATRLVNMYGITETTVHVTFREIERADLERPAASPIGRGLADLSLYLLDRFGKPVPTGASGELHVGGAGLARGYLNRPALTADRFVADPFAGQTGARMYRSGDLARCRADGTFEFLGRADDQVKIRGFRIELGEIESLLVAHPGIQASVVSVRENSDGDKRLVAYAVPSSTTAFPVLQNLRMASLTGASAEAAFLLPNGLPVFHRNQSETEFLFEEIFGNGGYLQQGIEIRDGDCVFDVGANIGLFSLFAAQRAQDVSVYSFEPLPPVCRTLRTNAALYGIRGEVFECGLAQHAGEASFTFYPHNTVISSSATSRDEARGVVKTFLENRGDLAGAQLDELLEVRLASEQHRCRLRTVSEIMADRRIEKIDLLKVDVEGSEEAVLLGIEAADWPKIDQLVVEVHDLAGRLARITDLLRAKGFRVTSEQDAALENTSLFNIYALRPERAAANRKARVARTRPQEPAWQSGKALLADVVHFLGERLPAHMVPTAIVFLEALPLTPNGKLDRRALPAPEEDAYARAEFESPQGRIERLLAGIWAQQLDFDAVGRDDQFLAIGGDSLGAVRVINRINQTFGIDLSIRQLLEGASLKEIAGDVATKWAASAQGPQAGPREPDPSAAPVGDYPATRSQLQVYFISQVNPHSRAYHTQSLIRLRGPLRVASLQQAISLMVDRHEHLRTTYHADAEHILVGRVHEANARGFSFRNLDDLPQHEREATLQREIAAQMAETIDPAVLPLVKWVLFRLAEADHALLMIEHHYIHDGWSFRLFLRELGSLYSSLQQGTQIQLPAATQFQAFARHQERSLETARLRRLKGMCTSWLEGYPQELTLTPARSRPQHIQLEGRQFRFQLPPDQADRIRDTAAALGLTNFQLLFAVFTILISRYSRERRFLLGTTTANRDRTEWESLIGMLVNLVPVAVDLANAQHFPALADRIRAALIRAAEWSALPFPEIVSAIAPARSPSFMPLIQVVFSAHNAWNKDVAFGDLDLEITEALGNGTAKFDLSVICIPEEPGGATEFIFEYNRELFAESVIAAMTGHYLNLLAEVAANPRIRLTDLVMLDPAERRRVLHDWNATSVACPGPSYIHQLFEARAAETPAAPAAVFAGEQVSYARLNARANRLAHHLIAKGVGPDDRVAVCLERGLDLLVSLLAVLKAGGSYVPLDPDYPAERLADMLRDCAPLALLTHARHWERAAEGSAGRSPALTVIDLNAEPLPGSDARSGNPNRPGLEPASLAYVIYTSGSTGRPKGVMNAHGAVVNRLAWMQRAYSLNSDDCILQKTPFTFDVSVWEFFWPLAAGARLVLARPQGHRDPAYLVEVIRQERVSTLHFVPSMLQVFLEHETAAACTGLTRVFCSGEALSADLVQRFHRSLPQTALHNLYGPTEAAVDVTFRACPGGKEETLIPIGRPIDNLRIYLLDPDGRPVPVGLTGELFIGGTGVARGYLGRPELTAERFLPDPFSADTRARMYRTGDLARHRQDGEIEFLGREDFQVKIRGFRIEPGEIEARLIAHPRVREAVVMTHGDTAVAQNLVAYYVADDRPGGKGLPTDDERELREYLAGVLPEYMVPAAFIRLETLPLTDNGKLDRRALTTLRAAGMTKRGYEAPQGEVETVVAGLWRDLLKLERVGRWDHFFKLGGQSLLAVQLTARLRQALGIEAPLTLLFAHPTLADFAERLGAAAPSSLPAIAAATDHGRLPLSLAQQRLWFLARMDRHSTAYNMQLAWHLSGPLDRQAFIRALNRLLARHDILRTTIAVRDGEPLQIVAPVSACRFHLSEHDLAEARDAEGEWARLLAAEARLPFDLERGPLVRGRLMRLGPDAFGFILSQHHIVSDGWSTGILLRELNLLYEAYRDRLPDPLPPPRLQYGDFAAWQQRWLNDEVLRPQIDYWRHTLAGAPALLDLPTDHNRPAVQDLAGSRIPFVLEARLTTALRRLAEKNDMTLFMCLLSGWALLLARLSGQDDVVVGMLSANRGRTEIENLIGFFVNTLALRIGIADAPAVPDFLASVKTRILAAQQHQDLPFERVVEIVGPERSAGHNPLVQAMFAWQPPVRHSLDLPQIQATPAVRTTHATAKFDMSLILGEEGEAVAGALEFATSLFGEATARRYLDHWLVLLEAMARERGTAVDRLPLLRAAERRHLLETWNDTAAPWREDLCIHQFFEAWVTRTPDTPALICGDRQLDYAALNERANRLAHHLIKLGIRPDDRIAICLPRGIDMIVALLATLKAGGAFLPLDPTFPRARLAFMLQDAAATVLITRTGIRSDGIQDEPIAATSNRLAVVDLAAPAPAWARRSIVNPDAVRMGLTPAHLAYVIYTSGSTGLPKGVMLAHSGLCNLATAALPGFKVRPRSRVLQFAAFGFDGCVFEVVMALCRGATLVLADGDEALVGQTLLATIAGQAVTHAILPPAALAGMADHSQLPALRGLILSGEALSADLVRRYGQAGNLLNGYGPTEATVCTTLHPCTAGHDQNPPIGAPITNVRVYLLDPHGQPVPIGVTGEIHIAGPGLARGYLNQPALTASRFLPEPFSGAPGARMYRTGDLARYRADGGLLFLGRSDDQVKLRGFRVELSEIGSRLREFPGVRQALAVVRDDGDDNPRLLAYIVPHEPGEAIAADRLRRFLSEKLPRFMIPVAFIFLPSLPLTTNGKIDHAALPAPATDAFAQATYAPPQGDMESALAEIWAALFKLQRVGRNDNFFQLGGHSLLVITFLQRLEETFEVAIPPRDVFDAPVLADLAPRILVAQLSQFDSEDLSVIAESVISPEGYRE